MLSDILSFYLASEKIHWHLRLNRCPSANPSDHQALDTLAKELNINTLRSISLRSQLSGFCGAAGGPECDEVMVVIAQRFSELSQTQQ